MLKNLSMLAMLLGLGLFVVGCQPTTEDAVEELIEAEAAQAEAHATEAASGSHAVTGEEVDEAQQEATEETQEAEETAAEASGNTDGGATPPPAPTEP